MSWIKIISCLLILVSFTSMGQVKGKALKLIGTWKYNQGSGYESWFQKDDKLIGAGYRTTKLGDSVKVEDLSISMVNKNLIYTLQTKQAALLGDTNIIHRFVGNKRKLFFENMDNDMPSSIKYRFGLFNKKKLLIYIHYREKDKQQKLRLTKITG